METCKIPRDKFQKVYAVGSGYCVEFKSHKDRKLLTEATTALPTPIKAELENLSVTSYYLANVPKHYTVPDGAQRLITTEILAAKIKAATGLDPILHPGRKTSIYTVVMTKCAQPFRGFDSEAAKLLQKNPSII